MAGRAVWIDVLPAMNKLAPGMTKGATSAGKTAGLAAGKAMSTAMAAGAKGGAGANALVKELELASKKAQRAITNEKTAIFQARNAEKAAAQGVQAAEARLAEQRTKAQAVAAKVASSESALALARQKHGVESVEAARAEQTLLRAQAGAQAQAAAMLKSEQAMTVARGKVAAAGAKTAVVEESLREAFRSNSVIANQLGAANASVARQTALTSGAFAKQAALGAPLATGLGKVGNGLKSVATGAASTLKPLASMAGGFAAIVGVGKIVSLGNEYTKTMNELGAVTNANAQMMTEFGAKTRALGADLQLPATSGRDAAAVMLELAKGGFSAQGAMEAARGTIILAAAAQVDGARAAEIQANAMNQFGLSAKSATMVADVLANTANAAAGGVDDIATSLKYVGPVAKTLGIDIKDTASSIGLLANAGLKGDTAGTALRGMLASLARPSKQAQKGVDALGLSVFDSQGRFVGMRKVIESLSEAQKTMTQEQFAAQAVLAFGREPLAAVTSLASTGAKGFDAMSKSVGRAGGATAVATSKMKGLGGAMDKLESQLEDVALGIYQTVAPALTAAVTGIAGSLDGAGNKVQTFLDIAGGLGKLAITGKVSGDLTAATNLVPDSPQVKAILQARQIVVDALRDIQAFVASQLVPSLKNAAVAVGPLAAIIAGVFVGSLRAAGFILVNVVGPALVTVTGFLREHQGVVIALAAVIGYLVLAYKAQQLQLAILNKGGLLAYVSATKLGVFWSNAMAAAMTLQKVGLYAYRAVVFTAVVATQGWAAAQEILNIALIANPIGLLITGIVLAVAAIAALVAGVIWAYKNLGWFKAAVDAVWTGIKVGAAAVGAAAVWLWKNAFVPAWQGIVAAAQWAWNTILKPTFDGIAFVVRAVAAVFTWWYQTVIAPVFRGIVAVVSWFWNTASAIFDLAVAIVKFTLAPVFSFLSGIVKTAFQVIILAAQLWWQTVSTVFLTAVGFIRTVLGAAFSWLYNSIVKPTFQGIAAVATWLWTVVIRPVVQSWVGLFRNVLAPAFTWLYRNGVKPAFDGIKLAVSTVWEWLKPIFSKLEQWAKVTLPAAFTVMKNGIKAAWNAIKSTATAPIKFVVNTVINDALIGNFNKVADAFGTKHIDPISLPKGFAGGGIIPGRSRMGDGDDHLRPMRRGEGVLVSEGLRTAADRAAFLAANAAGRRGVGFASLLQGGYAKGGVVGSKKNSGADGGKKGGFIAGVKSAWKWTKGAAGNAWDWTKNAAKTAASVVSDPMGTLGKLVKSVIGNIPGSGRMVELGGGMASKMLSGAVAALKKIGEASGTVFGGNGKNGQLPSSALQKVSGFTGGPGVGSIGGYLRKGAAAAWERMQAAFGGGLSLTEGYRDLKSQQMRYAAYRSGKGNLAATPGTSIHGFGLAADVGGGSQAWMRANGPRFGWYPTGLSFAQREPWHFEYKGGTGAPATVTTGKATLYDQGGYLPTGVSLVENRTGKPEPVLTNEQFRERVLERTTDGSGDGKLWRDVHFHGGDEQKQMRTFTRTSRRIERGGPV